MFVRKNTTSQAKQKQGTGEKPTRLTAYIPSRKSPVKFNAGFYTICSVVVHGQLLANFSTYSNMNTPKID